jgi:phospholipid/cholesterol/gamma-HCH transport system substrate-binding protein
MQPSPTRDLVVGLFVACGIAALAYLSIQVGGLSYKGPGGLLLSASFDEIGSLSVRAPVVISGVKVGKVSSIELGDDLRARVVIELDASLEIPIDSTAGIRTAGLLGDQFIAVEPGAEEDLLISGDSFSFTDSAINLESLIGQVVHGFGGDE